MLFFAGLWNASIMFVLIVVEIINFLVGLSCVLQVLLAGEKSLAVAIVVVRIVARNGFAVLLSLHFVSIDRQFLPAYWPIPL